MSRRARTSFSSNPFNLNASGSHQALAQGNVGAVRKSFEMPVLHTTPDDFGLGDLNHNRHQLKRLLAAPHKVLYQDENVLLGISRHSNLIEIFLHTKAETALTYYLRSKAARLERLGIAATEVALWRRCAPGLERGTSGVVYALLDECDAIVGHPSATPAGQRYWIDRMAEGYARGLTVGMMDGNIPVPYKGRYLLDWVQAQDGGGGEGEHKGKPFFIAKKLAG